MVVPNSLRGRLIGFTLLPALAAVSPLLVLPIVSRVAGPAGWSSAIAGESIGTFAAIAIAYGWGSIGPALVSVAGDDQRRGQLYRESLVVRLLTSAIALPILAALCWLVASPGFELFTILMGVQGALIAWTFSWFAAGIGNPWSIAWYDAIPRLVVAIAAAAAIAITGNLELYPAGGIVVTLIGTGWYSVNLLRRYPATWPTMRSLPRLFRAGAPVAVNDAALGAYQSVPAPLVNLTAVPISAAGFASADKMLKLGQFLPITLANALQSWIGEVDGRVRAQRMRSAVMAHAGFGLLGGLIFATAGPAVSQLLFGVEAAAPIAICVFFGISFALYSVRTSLTRHLLFPAGRTGTVVRATVVATAIGFPAMIALSFGFGPVGVAAGLTATEAIASLLLVRESREAVRRLEVR